MNIARYRIIEEIGRGAMGVVYKAHDPNLDLVLALKVLRRDRVADEPFVRRFMAEARALGRLDHPDIVRVFNVDRDGDDVYIAMEFVDGTPLSTRMKERPYLPEQIAEFGGRMAVALDYAHRKGIIHRDVKPGNILCVGAGTIKITDFGIAHIEDPLGNEETLAGEILGTPAYMSPEQVLGRPVDGRSDLFSLGIILYEMATGSRPFPGKGLHEIFTAITTLEPPPVQQANPAMPVALGAAIMKSLEKSPAKRFADGRELAAAIASAAPPPSREGAPGGEPGAARNRLPLYFGGGVLALLVAGGYLFTGGGTPPGSPVAPPSLHSAAGAAGAGASAPAGAGASLLKAQSVPEGAALFVDGVRRGETPARVSLPPGRHELALRLPGYDSWEALAELEKDAETPVSVELTRAGSP